MIKVLIILAVILVLAAIVFGVMRLVTAGRKRAPSDPTSEGGKQPPGRAGRVR